VIFFTGGFDLSFLGQEFHFIFGSPLFFLFFLVFFAIPLGSASGA
jgi:hypothetical protein